MGGHPCVAIYSRKSRFTGKGESIENQIELCRQYIRLHSPEIGPEQILIYEDEGFSGKNTERPQFQQMMSDGRKGRFGSVVCYRLDRVSRNIGDFAALIEELGRLGIDFVSIREQFDTSSPMGRAMMYIASVFSQLERETIAERIRDNMRELAKTGRWLGGVTPTGYGSEAVESVTLDGKPHRMYRLITLPEEAGLVRTIYAVFLACGSLTKTETWLLQHGYRTKNGREFTRFAVKNILQNPVYLTADEHALRYLQAHGAEIFSEEAAFDGLHGVMAYNKTDQSQEGAARVRQISDWIVAIGRHEGLISGADWVRAQAMLEENRSKAYRRPRGETALLSGLLVCGGCGGYLRPKLSQREDSQGRRFTYLCQRREKSRGALCKMKGPDGNMLDALVCSAVGRLPEDRPALLRALSDGEGRLQLHGEGKGMAAELRRRLSQGEAEISALLTSLPKAAGTPAEEHLIEQIGTLHEKNAALRAKLEELSLSSAHPLNDEEASELAGRLASFDKLLGGMEYLQKREALRVIVRQVVWDGENAQLIL